MKYIISIVLTVSATVLHVNTLLVQSKFQKSTSLQSSVDAEIPGYFKAKFPGLNIGASFSKEKKDELGIRGLYPVGQPISLDDKLALTMEQFRSKTSPLEKYIYLHTIQDADETLYYAALIRHTTEVMPFVYTPTVGEACQKWNKIFRHTPRGLYLGLEDIGQVRQILNNQPNKDIKVVVVTDGERILGLGDLGANGMGIPIGKLALYVACAGIHPSQCLPVHLDVGTNNEALLADPTYMGMRQKRDRSPAFDQLVAEFFTACQDTYGKDVLIQFEDFGNSNAFRLLEHYRSRACCFNDDIQGTASVVLSGLISSLGLANKKQLSEHRFLFFGAGEAGVGIADLVASTIAREMECTMEEARARIWLVDSQGLVTNAREDADKLAEHKKPYAHIPRYTRRRTDLLESIKAVQPTALIGVSAQGGAFSEEVVREMCRINARPVVFALSNPTSKAECTAQQAFDWSEGRAIFASGSPFPPIEIKKPDGTLDRVYTPGQGNNAYIFPGVGLAAVVSGATSITDEDFQVAASTLAAQVSPERIEAGCLYPPLSAIREVSAAIAAAVAEAIHSSGRATKPKPADLLAACKETMYVPEY